MDSQGMKSQITEDTRLKGEATPGTNTPCVAVAPGEIEVPADTKKGYTGEVMKPDQSIAKGKSKAKRKAKRSKAKSSKPNLDGETAYDLKAGGMTWTEVASHLGGNSPWMVAKIYAELYKLPYPPEKRQLEEKGLIESVADAVKDHAFPEDDSAVEESTEVAPPVPATLPPVLPTYRLYELKKHPHMEKTAVGHTHTLVFEIGNSVRNFGLCGEPTNQELLDIISRETRKLMRGR